jgi:hypothetical protein
MDSLKLVAAFDRSLLSGGRAGTTAPLAVTVAGVLLQGAAMDAARGSLADALPDSSEVQPLPELHLAWVPGDAPEPYAAGAAVLLPLYQSLDRERLVVEVALPAGTGGGGAGNSAATRFTLAGAALFLEER